MKATPGLLSLPPQPEACWEVLLLDISVSQAAFPFKYFRFPLWKNLRTGSFMKNNLELRSTEKSGLPKMEVQCAQFSCWSWHTVYETRRSSFSQIYTKKQNLWNILRQMFYMAFIIMWKTVGFTVEEAGRERRRNKQRQKQQGLYQNWKDWEADFFKKKCGLKSVQSPTNTSA